MLRTMWLHAHASGDESAEFWQELRIPYGISFTILTKFSWLREYVIFVRFIHFKRILFIACKLYAAKYIKQSVCCRLEMDSMLIRNALFSKLFFHICFPSSLCSTQSMCNSLKFLCVCLYVPWIYACVFTCVGGYRIDRGCFSQFFTTLFIKVRSCLDTRLTYFCKLRWPACSTGPRYWPPEC